MLNKKHIENEVLFEALAKFACDFEEVESNLAEQLGEAEINLINHMDYYNEKVEEAEDRLATQISNLKESVDWQIFELREMIRQLQEMIERKVG